jgi:hypothetical protein
MSHAAEVGAVHEVPRAGHFQLVCSGQRSPDVAHVAVRNQGVAARPQKRGGHLQVRQARPQALRPEGGIEHHLARGGQEGRASRWTGAVVDDAHAGAGQPVVLELGHALERLRHPLEQRPCLLEGEPLAPARLQPAREPHGGPPATPGQVGGHQHDPADGPRLSERGLEGDASAHGHADQQRRALQRAGQLEHRLGEARRGERPIGGRGAAEAGQISGEGAESAVGQRARHAREG